MIDPVIARPDRVFSKRGATRRALTAVVVLVWLTACGSTPSAAKETTAKSSTPTGTVEVPKLLQFSAPLVGGGNFAGADYAGRASAFWFWAPT